MTARGLGYLVDAQDPRDLMLSVRLQAGGSIPSSLSLYDARQRVRHQGEVSWCVGFAGTSAVRLGYLAAGVDCPELSPCFLYRGCRNVDGTNEDAGTYIRSAMRVAMKLGLAAEMAWPTTPERMNEALGLAAAHAAHDRFGTRGYYRVASGDTDGIRLALASGFPVVAGWTVDRAFMRWDGAHPIPADLGAPEGGHAMAIVGYRADGTFDLLNSWGTEWGQGGFGWASEGFAARARDVWAIDLALDGS